MTCDLNHQRRGSLSSPVPSRFLLKFLLIDPASTHPTAFAWSDAWFRPLCMYVKVFDSPHYRNALTLTVSPILSFPWLSISFITIVPAVSILHTSPNDAY